MIKVWAGLSSLQRLQRRSLWPGPVLGGRQATLGFWPHHPDLCVHLHKPSPLGGSVPQITPLFFQGHLSLDLGSTCIPGDLVQRSGTYFHLPRPFIGIRPPLEAAEGWMAFGATTQPTILVMKPQGRASLGLVKGASKKQGSVLGLPQENS